MWLLMVFIAIPMIEIALFIQVGGLIGLGWTLAIVLFTAVLGTWLVRQQGALAMNNIRKSFSELSDPSAPLADAAMILLAGALLVTPGFFTDALGFALLTPAFRRAAFTFLRKRIKVQSFAMGSGAANRPAQDADIIEGDYSEIDPPKRPTHRPSGWTQH
ncbi:FxsA family protein [Pseudooceanicola sediminis]|uniref:FxsA family protein n=1 Tax=Pseudooceanicola sediminis TaxID=2211117 RepID=A0A399J4I0_9RHOB|nr:FxsA family protein [Pseudooceanicola sediminis]KAA2315455.1 FxsA family protein [Puniceibacterium sp. HSS470]RII40338.1 FxsA family protein [Pseudooceanicola sediminis]|tara:strand:+ start:33477 stop:33956 length:480 start_codon:yes stop_codon:yes gene_type:complete